MKTLLTSLLLFVGALAFANDNDNQTNPGETEKGSVAKTAVTTSAKKEASTALRIKPEAKPIHSSSQKPACTTGVDTRFGIGDVFVEFVNKSNLKLVKYLLD